MSSRLQIAALIGSVLLAGTHSACSDDAGSSPADTGGADTSDTGADDGATDAAADPDTTSDRAVSDTRDLSSDQADSGDDVAPDPDVDLADSDVCPEPPPDLPEATLSGNGRLQTFGQLNGDGVASREVRVYLPVDYDQDPDRRYPVLYMHDGQNLFHDFESFAGAWEVDDIIDDLTAAGDIEPWIVVGLHNTADRIDEYTPGPTGEAYLDFVVDVAMPVVNREVRTLCGPDNTAMAGSSLGGLIGLVAALEHPDVFGRVAAVSPSIWWNDRVILDLFEANSGPLPERIWLDGGSAEGGATPGFPQFNSVIANIRDMRTLLLERGLDVGRNLGHFEALDAAHNEQAWEARLDAILAFLLTDEDWTELPLSDLVVWPFGDYLHADGSPGTAQLFVQAFYGGRRRMTLPNEDVTLTSLTPALASVAADGWISVEGTAGEALIQAGYGDRTSVAPLPILGEGESILLFRVEVPEDTPPEDTIYITGDVAALGEWDGAGLELRHLEGLEWRNVLYGPTGTPIEFKVTRGSFETVEKNQFGAEIANRQATINGTRPSIGVARWADSE